MKRGCVTRKENSNNAANKLFLSSYWIQDRHRINVVIYTSYVLFHKVPNIKNMIDVIIIATINLIL